MKRWQMWLGIAISAIFIYLSLRGLSLDKFISVVRQANYLWLLPGVGIYFLAVWVRAWRWHYLLKPIKPITTAKMFPIVAIGYMGNNLIPARIGEVLRAVVLKRREGINISASLATIFVERVYDGVVMLGFVFLNLPELSKISGDSGFIGDIQSLAIWGAALFLGVLAGFLAIAMLPDLSKRLVTWIANHAVPKKFIPSFVDISTKFIGGLKSLSSPKEALMVFITSTIIWLFETGKYWFVMQAFDFEVSFFALMLMNGIVNLATTIPSAPGYIGTFDAPGIAVLVAFGVENTIAAGYTLVLHVALWLPITVLGAYYFLPEWNIWRSQGISLLGQDKNLTDVFPDQLRRP